MDGWKALLDETDDDYLIGISNKGIVKRAYKDKTEGDYQVLSFGEEAEVSAGGEIVHIKVPLGESTCSCPSRTICRHVILGILALKEWAEEKGKEETAQQEQKEEIQPNEMPEKEKHVEAEIEAYPLASILRTLGSKQLQYVIRQAESGQKANMVSSSVIMVEPPGMEHKVKLLSPLEYSSCTCHKKDFCIHKAAAILWYKLEAGMVTIGELKGAAEEKSEYNKEQVKEAAGQMKVFLEELLNTGLARASSDVADYLERLATISHNARLARFEGYWRALYDSYGDYWKRKASFRVQDLMGQLTRLYRRTELLWKAEDGAGIGELAGEFRAEYKYTGSLDLTGIAIEHFESKTGYEGDTVYLIEDHTKEWYTYTSARPVYYEKTGRQGRGNKAQTPGNLPLTLEALAETRIHLDGAKWDGQKRISSSQETKGELIENWRKAGPLPIEALGEWYYRDFGSLYEEQIGKKEISWLMEKEKGAKLVVVCPYVCKKAFFSETEQKLFMSLYDEKGREIVIEAAYSKKDARSIRCLERITEENIPCFLGKIYMRDGKIRMHPVEVFGKEELLEKEMLLEEEKQREDGEINENGQHKEDVWRKGEALEILLEEVGNLLEELFQSGFRTVHDSTMASLENMEELAVQYGMQYLADMLGELKGGLAKRRHSLERPKDGMAETYTRLNEYLYLCREKAAYDKGLWYYKG